LANNFGIYHRYCRWLDGDAGEGIGRSVNQVIENRIQFEGWILFI
jgi:hypothetical protein